MRITHLNNSDITGGAARAAYRIHQSLLRRDVHSRMWVKFSQSDDWTVIGPKGKWQKGFAQLRRHILAPTLKIMKSQNKILHSPAVLPSFHLLSHDTCSAPQKAHISCNVQRTGLLILPISAIEAISAPSQCK